MFAATLALTNRAWAALALGDPRPELFERNLRLAARLDNVDGAAYAFEGLIAIAVVQGDPERAGVLTGAAEAVRQATGVGEQASIVTYEPFVEAVLALGCRPGLRGGARPRPRDDGLGGDGVRTRALRRRRRMRCASIPRAD